MKTNRQDDNTQRRVEKHKNKYRASQIRLFSRTAKCTNRKKETERNRKKQKDQNQINRKKPKKRKGQTEGKLQKTQTQIDKRSQQLNRHEKIKK